VGKKQKIKRILISMTAHMGDFIWATSAFAVLKKTEPNIKITVMVPKTIKELIINNPVIDSALYCPYSDNNTKSRIKKLLWAMAAAPKVFFKRFDAAFIFDSSRAAILTVKLARIPRIIGADLFFSGYDKPDPAAKYYTDKIPVTKDQDFSHLSTRYQTIIKSFFGIYNNAMPVIPDSSKYSNKAANLIKDKEDLRVAVCVRGNRTSTNIWNINNFQKTIELLNDRFKSIVFYLIGTSDAYEYSGQIANKNNIYNICGQTGLLELKEFLKLCDLLISSDTGVIHMAALSNINIISLHGYTSQAVTGPMSHNAVTFHREPECFPCAYRAEIEKITCPTHPNPKCFVLIKPQEVADAAAEILEKKFL
jgi:ADP-heptose:LPS heptosyltransferase